MSLQDDHSRSRELAVDLCRWAIFPLLYLATQDICRRTRTPPPAGSHNQGHQPYPGGALHRVIAPLVCVHALRWQPCNTEMNFCRASQREALSRMSRRGASLATPAFLTLTAQAPHAENCSKSRCRTMPENGEMLLSHADLNPLEY